MNEQFFKKLGKTAADAFAKGESLNNAITKIAQEHALNANQIARVCEAANLNVYTTKMASASTRRDEFDLADHSEILNSLKIEPEAKPVKSAAAKDIDYFIKTASINQGSVFAPEYDIDGKFLNNIKPEPDIIKVAHAPNMFDAHKNTINNRKAVQSNLKLKQAMEDLNADLIMAKLSLAGSVKQAMQLIKQSAMSSNPFTLWRSFDSDAVKAEIADAVFTKAAEAVTKYNPKLAAELLLEAKSIIPEHDASINERNIKIVNKDPIIKIIDDITNYTRIVEKIEKFKSCDGINEPSSTPTANVAYTIDEGQPALNYYKKLIEGE